MTTGMSRCCSDLLEETLKKTESQLHEVASERDSVTKNLAEALKSLKQVS